MSAGARRAPRRVSSSSSSTPAVRPPRKKVRREEAVPPEALPALALAAAAKPKRAASRPVPPPPLVEAPGAQAALAPASEAPVAPVAAPVASAPPASGGDAEAAERSSPGRDVAAEAPQSPPLATDVAAAEALRSALEAADTFEALLALIADAGRSSALDAVAAAVVMRRLPPLLAAAMVGSPEGLAKRLESGERVEPCELPTLWPADAEARAEILTDRAASSKGRRGLRASASEFLWVHECIVKVLDNAVLRGSLPLTWLADVAVFYGTLRPGPPLALHVLEDCADEALRRLRLHRAEARPKRRARAPAAGARPDGGVVADVCCLARGAASSQALAGHGLFAAVAARAAAAIAGGGPPADFLASAHDAALALALARPWDPESDLAATRLRAAVCEACADVGALGLALASGCVFEAPKGPWAACASKAGERNGQQKENQDAFHISIDGDVAAMCVVDGHGKHGGSVSSAIRDSLRRLLPQVSSGEGAAKGLARAVLAADTALLLNDEVDSDLSGATCAVCRVEGLADPGARRLAAAHVGDCRVLLGRREEPTRRGEAVRWRTVRLTEDHRPDSPDEARRLLAAGARVQRAQFTVADRPPCFAGPSRLWHRGGNGLAPGLAMSRGMGDVLGQGCGLLAEATSVEIALTPGDALVVVASDGIFDVLSDAEVLHCCRTFWQARKASDAAASVVAAASRAWGSRGAEYRDDCTCVVLFF